MKKSLIALAALASVAGVAQAQSSVEVYGLIDMSVGQASSSKTGAANAEVVNVGAVNNAGGASTSGNGQGSFYGQRLGFRGTEDLGGGNKASFVLEAGLAMSNASGGTTAASQNTGASLFNNVRQGYVALGNAQYGELRAGTFYNPVDATGGSIAATSANGGSNHVTGATNLLKLGQGDTARFSNGIMYTSPTYNGLTLRVANNFGESTTQGTNVKTGDGVSYGLDYVSGKFKGGVATFKLKNTTNTAAAVANFVGSNDTAVQFTGAATDIEYTVGGAMYDFGFANIGYQHAEYKNTPLNSAAGQIKHKVDLISATVPLGGAWSFKPGYAIGQLDQSGTKVYNTSGIDASVWYSLSKRTNLYVSYNEQKFEGKSGTDNGLTIKSSNAVFGVTHAF